MNIWIVCTGFDYEGLGVLLATLSGSEARAAYDRHVEDRSYDNVTLDRWCEGVLRERWATHTFGQNLEDHEVFA